jgi:ATP:ADP antiporter, AAA family
MGAWSFALLTATGLSAAGLAIAALVISAAWMINGFWLGREQEPKAASATREAGVLPGERVPVG